jgi:hypothetical protein
MGPQGAENRPKARGRIYHFIRPKVCPILTVHPHDSGLLEKAAATAAGRRSVAESSDGKVEAGVIGDLAGTAAAHI